jgi:hypothetical protein
VACDADGDGTYAADETCDAMAGDDPRDCDDDDDEVYPGAAPVCGDGKINGCDAGPESFREALSVGEIGAIGGGRRSEGTDDLFSLDLDLADDGVVIAFVRESGSALLSSLDVSDLSELSETPIPSGDDVLAIGVRRADAEAVHVFYLSRTSAGDAVVSSGVHRPSIPGGFAPADYTFDDSPCIDAADAAALSGDFSVLPGSAVWTVESGVAVRATSTVACTSIAGTHRSTATDGFVVGLVEPITGERRTFGGTSTVSDLDSSAPGPARDERPGFAFLRAAAAQLYLSASVSTAGRTRVIPVDCPSSSCSTTPALGATYASAADVFTTYGSSLDGLVGDFAAMVQIEERATAPAPDDRSHDVVLRLLEYPSAAIGSAGGEAPGESLVLYTHTYDSADPDHPEVREVDVATIRDASSGDMTVYWAATIGDRRLAPGSMEDPNADNEVRYGGVRFCVSE